MKRILSIMLLSVLTCTLCVQAGTRLLPLPQQNTIKGGKVYIVSAGIADYPGTVNDLNYCDADARTFASVYGAYSNVITRVLTNSQVTQSNVLAAMQQIFLKATANDAIIFFFSGHGSPGSFVTYDGELKYERIYAIMKKSKAKTKCIFADACYAGKARTSTSQRQATAKNVMLFLSSRTNETSLEIGSLRHGLFAYYIEKAMRGAADTNRDRAITAVELFNYVSKNVANYAKTNVNHQQHPVMWGNFPKNMVIFRY